MRIAMCLLFSLIVGAFAGTGTLLNVSGGKVQTTHVNQYYSALNQDVVPRNSSGVATDLGGNLGQSALRWGIAYENAIQLGANADNIQLTDSSSNLNIIVGGNTIFSIPSTGSAFIARKNLPSVGQQTSSSSSTFSTSSTSFTNVTGLSVTFTTTGRPVMLLLQPDGSGNTPLFGSSSGTSNTDPAMYAQFLRDGTSLGAPIFQLVLTGVSTTATEMEVPPGSMNMLDTGATATSHTYTMQVKAATNTTALVKYCVLVAYEL